MISLGADLEFTVRNIKIDERERNEVVNWALKTLRWNDTNDMRVLRLAIL